MKRVIFVLLALTLVTGWASPARAAGLKLTIRAGRVSLDAQDVTLRQILAEWARVGKTKIVNLDRVASAPLTLKFDNVPESEALDIVLRALPGYWAQPRATQVADASVYESIALMTTTSQVSAAPASAPRLQGQSFYQDPSANVTQLRPAPPPLLSPGVLPEPSDDPRNSNDPAIAAAVAAGLTAPPAAMPGTVSPPLGLLQPPVRTAGSTGFGVYQPGAPATPGTTAPAATPTNPWNAPVGTSMPGLATPAPSTTPPPNRPTGAQRPQQADQ